MVPDDASSASRRRARLNDDFDFRRIFLVEDEVIVAMDMADMLQEMGFEVVGPAVHLEEGEELARTAEIDAAFLDVNLGEHKTSKPIAQILRDRGIPFIFVTAYTPEQVTFRTSDERVLRKPVTSEDMLRTLRQLLPHYEQP